MRRFLLLAPGFFWLMALSCYINVRVQCDDAIGLSCPNSLSCVNNRCTCSNGLTPCGDTCIDTQSSGSNCGSCGKLCTSDKPFCKQGVCTDDCDKDKCGTDCIDKKTSPKHCGTCNNACVGGKICLNGKCECPSTFKNPGVCDDQCVDLDKSLKHCGRCSNPCPTGQPCLNGVCGICDEAKGHKKCGDDCVTNPQEDSAHCGGTCNNACTKGDKPACCKGACIDFKSSNDHCGKCNNACGKDGTCKDSTCVCAAGKESCTDGCVDIKSDNNNCGKCGAKCASGETCSDGLCCGATQQNCGGSCADIKKDLNHCGGCNKLCDKACVDGTCKSCTSKADCDALLDCDTNSGSCICGPKCLWQRLYGGKTASISPTGIAIDKAQNTYIVGSLKGSVLIGRFTLNSNKSSEDIFVLKLDSGGSPVWAKVFGGDSDDAALAISINAAGDSLAIAGRFTSKTIDFDGKTIQLTTGTDLFVAKMDPATGTTQWASAPVKADGTDRANGVAFDTKNNILITGSHSKEVQFGGTATVKTNVTALFVAKYDPTGKLIWATSTQIDSFGNAISTDGNDNVYVTGQFSDDFSIGQNKLVSSGSGDLFVVKIDDKGSFVWANGSLGPAEGKSIATTKDGVSYIGGFYQGGIRLGQFKPDPPNPPSGAFHALIAKLSKDGKFDFHLTPLGGSDGTTGASVIRSIALSGTTQNQITVTGYFTKEVLLDKNKKMISKDERDAFIASFEDKGNPVSWTHFVTAGGKGNTDSFAIAVGSTGSLYTAGSFKGELIFNTTPPSKNNLAIGTEDLFIWKHTP